MDEIAKNGFYFKSYQPIFKSPFDTLFEIFKELITHTSFFCLDKIPKSSNITKVTKTAKAVKNKVS